MGLNKDRFNSSHLSNKRSSTYKYAWGYLNPGKGELVVSNEIIFSSGDVSLKEVEYFIEDGILYLRAFECEWDYIGHYLTAISEWCSPYDRMFIAEDSFLERFHVPEEYIIDGYAYRKNWRKREAKIINCSPDKNWNWFRKKNTKKQFTYTLHPFKLKEE